MSSTLWPPAGRRFLRKYGRLAGGAIQQFPNFARQNHRFVGLVQNDLSFSDSVGQSGHIGAVSGGKNHRKTGMDSAKHSSGLKAPQARHHDVQDGKRDFAGMLAEDARGFFAIRRHEDVVATALEGNSGNLAKAFMVLGKQQGFRTAAKRFCMARCGWSWSRRRDSLPHRRKEQAKCRALAQFAFHLNMAVVLLDDAEDRGQSETGAFSRLFRSKERFENAVARGGVHAGASVGDNEFGVTSGSQARKEAGHVATDVDVARFDGEPAAFWHGVAGIDTKIEQDLLELGGVGAHRCQTWLEARLNLNVLADHLFKQTEETRDDIVYVNVLWLKNLAPREGKQLPGEPRGAGGLFANLDKIRLNARLPRRLFGAEFRPTHDGAYHIVKIVRDPAGQLADGFKLLRLAKLIFEGAALGHVFDDDLEAFGIARIAEHGAAGKAHSGERAILAIPFDLDAVYPAGATVLLQQQAGILWIPIDGVRRLLISSCLEA